MTVILPLFKDGSNIPCNKLYYLKLYLRPIGNRDWDKLNREKEEDLFMRESKMDDCNRHLSCKLFVPNNYN